MAVQYALGSSWEKFSPCVCLRGWVVPLENLTEEIETLISGYFPYPFFSRTFKYPLPFGLGNIQGSNVYFFLEGSLEGSKNN